MATSARTASLQAQRSGYSPYGSSGRIKILAPANNAISSIAKKTIASEIDTMISRYNAGEVSNADMKAFLEKTRSSVGISDADKLQIEAQIRDFDSKIVKDQLELNYQAAQENSPQQFQAAQALASYYNNRAGGMQQGTPAQIQALQNAATWNQRVTDIKTSMNKVAMQNLRYQEELKVNAIPDNTSEQAGQKALMYEKLMNQAAADGDQTGYNKYAALYQDAVTKQSTLSLSETKATNKKQLTDFINTTLNDYHDGKISGEQALSQLEQANSFAYEIDDTAALNRLNGLAITINREIDKGITYSNVNGLSVKNKGGGSGNGEIYLNPDGTISAGGASTKSGRTGTAKTTTTAVIPGTKIGGSGDRPKSITELALEYKDNILKANKALVEGRIPLNSTDGKPSYMNYILMANKERQIQLQNIQNGLDQLSEAGIKKVGGKSVEELRKSNTLELVNTTNQYNQVKSGALVLAMKDTDYTDATGNKSSKPTLQWTPKKDVKNMVNVNGIYNPTRDETATFSDRRIAEEFAKNENAKAKKRGEVASYIVNQVPNAAGEWDVYNGDKLATRSFLDVKDIDGNVVIYEKDSDYGWLPQAVGPKTGAIRAKMVKEYDTAKLANQDYRQNLMGFNQINSWDGKTPVGLTTPKPPVQPGKSEQVVNAIQNKVGSIVEGITAPVQPQAYFNPSQELVPSSQSTQNAIRTAPSSTSLGLASQPSAITKMATSSKTPQVQIPAPYKGAPVVNQKQISNFDKQIEAQRKAQNNSLAQKIGNVVSGIGTKITSLFKR